MSQVRRGLHVQSKSIRFFFPAFEVTTKCTDALKNTTEDYTVYECYWRKNDK